MQSSKAETTKVAPMQAVAISFSLDMSNNITFAPICSLLLIIILSLVERTKALTSAHFSSKTFTIHPPRFPVLPAATIICLLISLFL